MAQNLAQTRDWARKQSRNTGHLWAWDPEKRRPVWRRLTDRERALWQQIADEIDGFLDGSGVREPDPVESVPDDPIPGT